MRRFLEEEVGQVSVTRTLHVFGHRRNRSAPRIFSGGDRRPTVASTPGSLELAGAATRRTLDLFSLDIGVDTTVAAYIKWFLDGNQHYVYFGRDCEEPVEIEEEMARITRLAEDRWMLESVPENPARFCTRPVKGKTVPWVTVDSVYADFKLTFEAL